MEQYKKGDIVEWSAESIDYKGTVAEVYTDAYTFTVDGEDRPGTASEEIPTYLIQDTQGQDYIVDHKFLESLVA